MSELESIDVWAVWTNTDLTEGRGVEYVEFICQKEATARRLAKNNYVQGADSLVQKRKAYKIDGYWYYSGIRLIRPSSEDLEEESRLENLRKMEIAKSSILEKIRQLGVSDQEIKILQGYV